MPRVTHTPVTIRFADPADLSAMGTTLNLAFVAADVTNKERVLLNGKEIILARNTGAVARTVTVDGVKVKGRSGSITAYSIPAGQIAVIALPVSGWRQETGGDVGYLTFEANNAEVQFAVLKVQ
jgi:hypothetical protein